MTDVEVVIAGAGVIGLAVARALALQGRDVLVLEAAPSYGTVTSSRNSEVIHAGIYYPRGSLKARLCVAGRERLYEFCETHGVPHRRCGKLIVATTQAQLVELQKIKAAAEANGVILAGLSAAQAMDLEPALRCTGALLSSATGIIDSHACMLSLLGEAERHGASLVCNSSVTQACIQGDGVTVDVNEGETRLKARLFVNSAGLSAPALAQRIEGFPASHVPRAYLAKGNYFTLPGKSPFARLVYPVPEPGGLGVHLTLDLAGRARFGPDVQWVETLDYAVDASRSERFYGEVRKYWPALPDGALEPAYAGLRPKISGPGEPNADFVIQGATTHGIESVINLFGIESPGLTASLAIADEVAALANQVLGGVPTVSP
ncbi:MAG: NAD(P)/FAD-dependent oxidoreductase [Gammaproteobacteria bacterium]